MSELDLIKRIVRNIPARIVTNEPEEVGRAFMGGLERSIEIIKETVSGELED